MDVQKLEAKIKKHRELYYNGQPKISDEKFDELVDTLRDLSPDSLILKTVGALPKRRKIKLPFILGSLDKVGPSNIAKWMRKQNDDILATYKLDGVSIYAEWNESNLTKLTTRGDGEIGEDIFAKAPHFNNLPNRIVRSGKVAARGEALIMGKIPDGYKTRRNATAGIINRDDYKFADRISVIFYELLAHPHLHQLETESKRIMVLKRVGLATPIIEIFLKAHLNIRTAINEWIEHLTTVLKEKQVLVYDIDGWVLTANSSPRENVKIPKNRVAFKVSDLPQETTVTEVEWNTTRTGRVVPIVHIDMIEVDGVEIEHPTGHNYQWLKERKISDGAKISVVRSGDVIPYIVDIIKPAKRFKFPRTCPSCKTFLNLQGVDLICNNLECSGQVIAQIEYFIRMLGAEQIAIPTLEKFELECIEDFYDLTKKDIAKVDGLGEISADTILEERNKTLTTTEDKLLAAFGIPLIGPKIAKKIVDEYYIGRFGRIFNEQPNKLYDKVVNIDGIGPNIAQRLIIDVYDYSELYAFLKKKGLKFRAVETTDKLDGHSFQFTGKMSKSRGEMEEVAVNNGGRLASVSKKLDYLVVADKDTTSTKAVKARGLGIKIITEKQFLNMIE